MNRLFFVLFIVFSLFIQASAQNFNLYIGTYTSGESKGIYQYEFNSSNGKLELKNITEGIKNPSFLRISPDKKYLYSVAEGDSFNGEKGGGVSAYKIGTSGKLKFLNDALSKGAYPCHVTVSPDGSKVVASNYGGGNLAIYDVLDDGRISEIKQLIQHAGSGANAKRQASAHTHSALFNKAGTHLYAADLGIDKLMIYQFDHVQDKFKPADQAEIKMTPGAGPRHFTFTKNEDFLYVINELDRTVSCLKKTDSKYVKIQDISTLPEDFTGNNTCADIHLSKDEKYLYGSNRGHNSIVVFKRNTKNGKLKFITTVSVEGNWPRNFSLDPTGKYLLVANKESSNVTVFKIDKKSGIPEYTGYEIKVPNPVCIEFLVP